MTDFRNLLMALNIQYIKPARRWR